MEEMFQPVIAGYFIFCLQNRLWGWFTPQKSQSITVNFILTLQSVYSICAVTVGTDNGTENSKTTVIRTSGFDFYSGDVNTENGGRFIIVGR